jgi:hypothetical protein
VRSTPSATIVRPFFEYHHLFVKTPYSFVVNL